MQIGIAILLFAAQGNAHKGVSRIKITLRIKLVFLRIRRRLFFLERTNANLMFSFLCLQKIDYTRNNAWFSGWNCRLVLFRFMHNIEIDKIPVLQASSRKRTLNLRGRKVVKPCKRARPLCRRFCSKENITRSADTISGTPTMALQPFASCSASQRAKAQKPRLNTTWTPCLWGSARVAKSSRSAQTGGTHGAILLNLLALVKRATVLALPWPAPVCIYMYVCMYVCIYAHGELLASVNAGRVCFVFGIVACGCNRDAPQIWNAQNGHLD